MVNTTSLTWSKSRAIWPARKADRNGYTMTFRPRPLARLMPEDNTSKPALNCQHVTSVSTPGGKLNTECQSIVCIVKPDPVVQDGTCLQSLNRAKAGNRCFAVRHERISTCSNFSYHRLNNLNLASTNVWHVASKPYWTLVEDHPRCAARPKISPSL